MGELDKYVTYSPNYSDECDHCGTSGAIEFYETRSQSAEPATVLCGYCLRSETGRFKNRSPGSIVREYENIVELTIDRTSLTIETKSFLGKFIHIFYVEPLLLPTQQNLSGVQVESGLDLTGDSEVFTGTGQFVRSSSVYFDVASERIEEYNYQVA